MSMEGKPNGGASSFVSPQEKVVTPRTYGEYLTHFQIPEDELRSKRILDVGSGLSNFSKTGNDRLKDSGTMIVPLDPTYAFLSESATVDEYADKLGPANLSLKEVSGDKESWEDRFKTVKTAPFKVAGSHQHLPFAKGSFDLALAHNSILQFNDREVTRRALHEITEALAEHGELRILPSNLRRDSGSLYMSTFASPTPELLKEARALNLDKAPDRIIFNIFKELEEQGCSIYALRSPRKSRISGGAMRLGRFLGMNNDTIYSLVVRKDSSVPKVRDAIDDFYRLSFRDSTDGFHVPSKEALSEEDKAVWKQKNAERRLGDKLEEEIKQKIELDADNARMPNELKSDAIVSLHKLEILFTERMKELSRIRNERRGSGTSEQGFNPEEQKEWSARSATLGGLRSLFEEAAQLAGTKSRSVMSFLEVRHVKDAEVLTKIAEIYADVRMKLENVSS